MAFEYQYGIYNPGQYPADVQKGWDAMVADGWQIHTAAPAYNEIYLLWQRELPGENTAPEPDEPAPRKPRAAQKHRENPGDQTSGGLRAHEGQDAR